MRRVTYLLASTLVLLATADSPLRSAQKKVSNIEAGRFPATHTIVFHPEELLALGMDGVKTTAPGAITEPSLRLVEDGATATAQVNFDKLRESAHRSNSSGSDWLYSRLVSGVHPVSVSVETSSSGGTMTVHPTSVTVSGITLSGSALDFVIDTFLLPRYPEAVVNKPFRLNQNIDRIEVHADKAMVVGRR